MSPPTRTERALALAQQHVEAAHYMTSEKRFDEAHSQWVKAMALYEEAGDQEGVRFTWTRAGLCSQKLGEGERAVDEFGRAEALARVPGSERELAVILSHLGTLLAHRGAPAEAAAIWHEALELAQAHGEPSLVSTLAGNLGRLELGRGALDSAEAAFIAARDAAERGADDAERGAMENALGELVRTRGDLARAEAHFDAAFAAAQTAVDIGLMALALANLGNLARASGDLDKAESLFGASFNLASVTGDAPSIARAHTNLGNLAAQRGQLDEAQRHYVQALALDKRHGQAQAVVGGLVNLANLRAMRGDLEGARKYYTEALDKLSPLRSPRTMADVEALIGQVEGRLGHLQSAESWFQRALVHAREGGHPAAEARLAMNLAAIDYARGDVRKALLGYREAVHRLEAHASVSDMVTGHLVVADAALAANDLELAAAAVKEAEVRLLGDAVVEAREAAEARGPEHEAPQEVDGGADGDEGEAVDGGAEGEAVDAGGEGDGAGEVGEADTSTREYLDLRAMRARLAFARGRSATAREALIAAADALMEAGRTADALGERLALLDRLTPGEVDEPTLEQVREGVRWAEQAKLEPLGLDFRSAELVLTVGEPDAMQALLARAEAMGLGLLALRVKRRLALLLEARGRSGDAARLRAEARREALAKGALAEVEALDGDAARGIGTGEAGA